MVCSSEILGQLCLPLQSGIFFSVLCTGAGFLMLGLTYVDRLRIPSSSAFGGISRTFPPH